MKLKEDFKTQARLGVEINDIMLYDSEYRKLLEARLPAMEGKGQTESLRIKLRILLEMLGE